MSISKTDVIFLAQNRGRPSVVTSSNKENITVDNRAASVKKYHRHGFVNGLSADDKLAYNAILDSVKDGDQSPIEKINELKDKIEDLGKNTEKKNLRSYLQAELFHLTRRFKLQPDMYTTDARNIIE